MCELYVVPVVWVAASADGYDFVDFWRAWKRGAVEGFVYGFAADVAGVVGGEDSRSQFVSSAAVCASRVCFVHVTPLSLSGNTTFV